ncbi:PIG-L deacetylase family protein [Lysobacter xanthus]
MRSDQRPVALVLFAHPDDEFACSLRLRELVRAGYRVECAYLTDGGFGGQGVDIRERESLRALDRLGIPAGQVRFIGRELGIGDGTLPLALDRAWTGLLPWADAEGSIARVVTPAWEGGHQDHDATHLLALTLARRHAVTEVEQFPLYTGVGLPGPWFRVLHPMPANGPVSAYRATAAERVLAVRICLYFLSQWRTWLGLLPFFAWAMLVSGRFPRQPAAWNRLLERPHPGRLLYERRGVFDFERFRQAADRFMTVNPGC